MLLWHMGIATAIVYVSLGRRRIDYRFVLLGAILPDAVDASIGLFTSQQNWRGVAHSIVAVIVVAVIVLVCLKGQQRLATFGIAVGWLLHLVGDGMWQSPETFFWPAFGSRFSVTPVEPYGWDLLLHPWEHLSTWGGELVGLAILIWFYVAFELGQRDRRNMFLRDGHLRA